MTLLIVGYRSKKELKAAVGTNLEYREHGLDRFQPNGMNTVAHRPSITKCGGKEFFAQVTCKDGIIEKVK